MTKLVQTREDLAEALGHSARVLVPTMGALHVGHRALIETARAFAMAITSSSASFHKQTQTIVTIFVNPLQFEDPADFERYPNDLIADTALATEWGADIIWAPSFEDLFGDEQGGKNDPSTLEPANQAASGPSITQGDLKAGSLGEMFEGSARPKHFDGVLRAVAHLFAAVKPVAAAFGEKDFQQLVLVKRLAGQQHPPIEILAVPTERELDGLAVASRLVHLSQNARQQARVVPQALAIGVQAAAQGSNAQGVAAAVLGELDSVSAVHPDYVAIVDEFLMPPTKPGPARILLAATIEGVRIIDNQPIILKVI